MAGKVHVPQLRLDPSGSSSSLVGLQCSPALLSLAEASEADGGRGSCPGGISWRVVWGFGDISASSIVLCCWPRQDNM